MLLHDAQHARMDRHEHHDRRGPVGVEVLQGLLEVHTRALAALDRLTLRLLQHLGDVGVERRAQGVAGGALTIIGVPGQHPETGVGVAHEPVRTRHLGDCARQQLPLALEQVRGEPVEEAWILEEGRVHVALAGHRRLHAPHPAQLGVRPAPVEPVGVGPRGLRASVAEGDVDGAQPQATARVDRVEPLAARAAEEHELRRLLEVPGHEVRFEAELRLDDELRRIGGAGGAGRTCGRRFRVAGRAQRDQRGDQARRAEDAEDGDDDGCSWRMSGGEEPHVVCPFRCGTRQDTPIRAWRQTRPAPVAARTAGAAGVDFSRRGHHPSSSATCARPLTAARRSLKPVASKMVWTSSTTSSGG